MYESLDIEWDETYDEMGKFRPELGDKVLCCSPEIHTGEVVDVYRRIGADDLPACFYRVRLEDGSIDEFAEEDVLKRKNEEAA